MPDPVRLGQSFLREGYSVWDEGMKAGKPEQDIVGDLRRAFRIMRENTIGGAEQRNPFTGTPIREPEPVPGSPDLFAAFSRYQDDLKPVIQKYIGSGLESLNPDDLLAAVRGMSHAQRVELTELLGLPRPKHPFLWLPSGDGFSAPLVKFGP